MASKIKKLAICSLLVMSMLLAGCEEKIEYISSNKLITKCKYESTDTEKSGKAYIYFINVTSGEKKYRLYVEDAIKTSIENLYNANAVLKTGKDLTFDIIYDSTDRNTVKGIALSE